MNFSSLSNLSGNSHLWMMLGVLMVGTRKVDWYALSGGGDEPLPASS